VHRKKGCTLIFFPFFLLLRGKGWRLMFFSAFISHVEGGRERDDFFFNFVFSL
jgi:hypothetical protein